MRGAPGAAHVLLRPASVSEKSYAVARKKRHVCQGQGGIHRVIELAQISDASAQQAARIHHQPDRLASLHLMHLGDQLSAARGRGPANVAPLIALAVIAQALEFAPEPAAALQPLFLLYLPATHQIDRVLLRFFEIWIDAHTLLAFGHCPTLGQAQPALVANEYVIELQVSALSRMNNVAGGCFLLTRCDDLGFRRITPQRVRNVIEQARAERASAAVAQRPRGR